MAPFDAPLGLVRSLSGSAISQSGAALHGADLDAQPSAPSLAYFIAVERQEDDNREAIHATEARRNSGVRWSGLGPDRFIRRSESQLRAAANERRNRLIAHRSGEKSTMFGDF